MEVPPPGPQQAQWEGDEGAAVTSPHPLCCPHSPASTSSSNRAMAPQARVSVPKVRCVQAGNPQMEKGDSEGLLDPST